MSIFFEHPVERRLAIIANAGVIPRQFYICLSMKVVIYIMQIVFFFFNFLLDTKVIKCPPDLIETFIFGESRAISISKDNSYITLMHDSLV